MLQLCSRIFKVRVLTTVLLASFALRITIPPRLSAMQALRTDLLTRMTFKQTHFHCGSLSSPPDVRPA